MRAYRIAPAILILVLSLARFAHATYPDFYTYDPLFNGGHYLADGMDNGGNSLGQKLARLSNGDILAVGLVSKSCQGSASNGLFHIGLARYTASGGNGSWNFPDSYTCGSIGGPHLVYPTTADAKFVRIDDVAVHNGHIYVMADCECAYPSTSRDVMIEVFNEQGAWENEYGAFATGFDEWGAGLVASSYTVANPFPVTFHSLTAVATYDNAGRHIVTAAGYAVNKTDGSLTPNNAFGPYNSGRNDYPAADNFCSANANCTVEAAATTALRTGTDSPTIYVAASTLWSGNDWNIAMLEIDGTGAGQWDMTYSFARGGDNDDRAVSITASAGSSGDEVFLAAQVSTGSNSSGFALAKFTHANGIEGSLVIADGDVTTGRVYGYAIAMEGNLIGAVGSRSYTFGSGGYDPFLVVLTNNFTILDNHAQRLANPVCNPITHICFQTDGEYYGIIGSGDGGFYATGLSNDSSLDHTEFATAKFSNDRIFGDDFEGP